MKSNERRGGRGGGVGERRREKKRRGVAKPKLREDGVCVVV